jgi:hypothetical protein
LSLLDGAVAAVPHCLSVPDRFIGVFCLLKNMPQHKRAGKLEELICKSVFPYISVFRYSEL